MFRNSKFIFFGTPRFAAIILQKLIDANMPPAVVVCNPDRPVGRKKIITPPPVKARVMNNESGIKILQPEKLDNSFRNSLFNIHNSYDFAVVAAYAKIIPDAILKLFSRGVIGVHPSLLPKYRGATPIQSAILAGEEKTGVSLYLLDEKVDHGPVLAQEELTITNDDNYDTLMQKLAGLGGELLIKILPKFIDGKIMPQPQDESAATYTRKFTAEDAFVNEKDLGGAENGRNPAGATEIERKIRAFNPEPGVWTIKNGKRIKLLVGKLNGDKLKILELQLEGGKRRRSL